MTATGAPTPGPTEQPALEMRGISKRFGGTIALKNVAITAYPGQVLALMGENGAGKSTLMKVLAGVHNADTGEMTLSGQPFKPSGPIEARARGVNLIYQELSVAPNMTVAQNIFLGNEPHNGAFVDYAAMNRGAEEVLKSLGATFTPTTSAGRLSVAEQQLVEIARSLVYKGQVLIMDEPTAALSDRETERLFGIVDTLRAQGMAIIYISHRMNEIYRLADRVTVLRDGESVGTLTKGELSPEKLVALMVGRPLGELFEDGPPGNAGGVVLEVKNLERRPKVEPCSLQVRAGEIVGLSGVVGAGRTELARLIFGADAKTGGTVKLLGQPLNVRSPLDAIRAGIAYVPEDRKSQGLFLQMAVDNNLSVNVLPRFTQGGMLQHGAVGKFAQDMIKKLAIRVSRPSALVSGLSGGNQQKVLLGRWLAIEPKLLILDEPTRGVDIGAKAEIYRIIRQLADSGAAVLVISSELPEVIGLSDRIYVMREGHIAGELRRPGITQEAIMSLATGAGSVASAAD